MSTETLFLHKYSGMKTILKYLFLGLFSAVSFFAFGTNGLSYG